MNNTDNTLLARAGMLSVSQSRRPGILLQILCMTQPLKLTVLVVS